MFSLVMSCVHATFGSDVLVHFRASNIAYGQNLSVVWGVISTFVVKVELPSLLTGSL